MSNKENAFVTPHMANGELSNEQKDRISQHFRAAKAIFARKRPPDCGNFPKQFPQRNGHANMFKTPARDSSINRVHLAEIPMNTPSPLALKGSNFTNGECRSNLFTAGMYIKRDDSIKEVPMSTLSPFSVKGLHFSDGECGSSLSTAGTYVKRNDSINEIPMNTPSPFPVEGLNFSDGECGSSLSTAGVFVKRNDSINGLCTSKSIRRVPLAEVPMNTPSPFALKGFNLTDGEYGSYSCITGISINMSDSIDDCLHPSTSIKRVAHAELPTKTVSQVRPLECSTMRDSLLFSSVLDDDDFDESILEEIDALCEQKSAEKSERGYLNGDLQRQFDDRRWENNTISQPIATKEILNSEGTLKSGNEAQFIAEQSSELKEMENGSMPEDYSKYLQSLNDMQREAACSDISIPLMIIAGPGSGKTSTMVGRVLMLLNEGIGPSNILAMTFTTAAASEMRDRIGVVTGKATAKELLVSTFHSFSLQLCRSRAEKLGRTQEFLVYGHGQQRRAVIEAMRLLGDEKRDQNHDSEKLGEDSNGNSVPLYLKDKSKKWQKFVAQAKASGKTPDECRKTGDEMGAAILGNYNDILRFCNALDYHDLISCSVKLLTDFPEVIKECQESYKAIIVDEFQDTSGMQYSLMRKLASHSHITIVGDDDQSIFSFNGADISGFNSFRNDFPNHKEIRLNKNYRSTRCIVEAASSLIQNNSKRCQLKRAITDNSSGSKITIKECHNEDAQCSFVVDKILEATSDGSAAKCSYGNIAVLYRRQASGKLFQTVFRDRKIPFNIHGVAFYRKKAVKAIIAMLRTTLPGCDDGPHRQVFKALLPFEKEEKKRVIEHIDKISTIRKYSFISTARNIFSAKISGSFKRNQLTQGRKVLSTLEMISKLVHREQSISAVITSVANILPQKYLLEQRAVADVDGGKLLNEDNDLRSVLRYLLDDVSCFLSSHFFAMEEKRDIVAEGKGCVDVLKAFIDYITERERENFRSRRHDNAESVTLTTIHQSKGLEWDTVFIVKANDSEIPLLHEFNGVARENGTSVEEERRLLYVAMTRARKKLFILYVTLDSNWQLLQPSRFLKEIPYHLREIQAESSIEGLKRKHQDISKDSGEPTLGVNGEQFSKMATVANNSLDIQIYDTSNGSTEPMEACNGNNFLRRFNVDDRATVSHLFHQWAKKKAFQDPRRLLDKVGFVIDERLAVKKFQHKEVLRSLKTCLKSEDAFHYAEYILRWEQIPADQRAHLLREKQEHFQKLRIEKTMSSSAPTPKQISFLQSLGCTTTPSSRLHASRLIEEYKSL